jgi:hypothetical protein
MLIPQILYGRYPEVKKRVQKAVTQIINGESLSKSLITDQMLDTASASGLIYIGVPAKNFEQGENFHAHLVGDLVRNPYFDKKYSDECEERLYQEFLTTSWGVLMLISRENAQLWLRPKNRYRSFVDAGIRFQKEFTDIGDRFETIANSPRSFWGYPHGLFYAVANLGIPIDRIEQMQKQHEIPPLETLIPQ